MTKPKVRVMRDEELDRPAQIECRLNELRALLAQPGQNKLALARRIALLKERLNPNGTVKPAVPTALLASKADVGDWGDRRM
ncbi:MAG: hypothetical protein ABSE73_20720 [Planctomycetota bacterium]